MLSVIVLVKDVPQHARACVESVIHSLRRLGIEEHSELILLDDFSDAKSRIPELFAQAREATKAATRSIRFTRHSHYAYGVALGMSLTSRANVLFLSHDMMIAPHCLRELLRTSASFPGAGPIRPVSQHMDYAQTEVLAPPLPVRDQRDVDSFASLVASRRGGELAETFTLVGDAMLIPRAVIERIGVLDSRSYFGFMSDVDYGVRARRAGFRLLIARGAWLHHVGAAVSKEVIEGRRTSSPELGLPLVQRAYEAFRQKWDPDEIASMPQDYSKLQYEQLRRLSEPRGDANDPRLSEPPIALDPAVCQEL